MDHRPTKQSDLNLQNEAAAVRDADDLYRLYRTEWVIVKTFNADGRGAQNLESLIRQARDHVHAQYVGRVADERIRVDAVTDNPEHPTHYWVHVKLLKPNLKGEFKHAALAANHAEKQAWKDYEIVGRNSRRDFELRSYGVKKTD